MVERIKGSRISRRNKRLLLAFRDDCLLELSVGRVVRHLENMFRVAEWLRKDLDKVTKDDIKGLIAKLNSMPYSEWTKQFYRVSLRKFFKWLRKSEDYPDEVRWLKTTVRNNHTKLPEEILTQEEVKRLIMGAFGVRDRALVSFLYESGCRVGELLGLRIKDVEFDDYGAKVMLSGKTGMRRVRIVSSAPLLAEWINRHRMNSDPEAPLWINANGKQLGYRSVRRILKSAAKRAGIKKRVYPHLLRHSRATHLANHLTEAQMKEYLGWVQSSKMASIYVHLSGRDVDKAILGIYGIKPRESVKEELHPKRCLKCGSINPPTNKFCSKCGMVLDEETANRMLRMEMERRKADEILDRLVEDEEFREMLTRKIREILVARLGVINKHA